MKSLGFLSKIAICLTVCAGLSSADSLQLRNGRRLQGKYIGGTSTAIGFMSGASVEYFPTTDVLVLIFDNATDSSLGGAQPPSPMSEELTTVAPTVSRTRATETSTPVIRDMGRAEERRPSMRSSSRNRRSFILVDSL